MSDHSTVNLFREEALREYIQRRQDEKFLACAIVSEANFLITGDYDFE